jgi:hypothetical protein
LVFLFPFFPSSILFGQNTDVNDQRFSISIDRSYLPIVIDGKANEASWVRLNPIKNFYQSFP